MSTLARTDRRQRRRQETIAEALDVAVQLMAEQGVAGLSLGEVARRMGIRPPSLYVYFDSKNALYDAIFARGWRALKAVKNSVTTGETDAYTELLRHAEAMVRWSMENPVYSQLMFWRPVPGFEPSPEAYEPAVDSLAESRKGFVAMQDRGALRADVDVDEVLRAWTVVTSGVISQQLSNAPGETYKDGRFTTLLPQLVEMFTRHYAPDRSGGELT